MVEEFYTYLCNRYPKNIVDAVLQALPRLPQWDTIGLIGFISSAQAVSFTQAAANFTLESFEIQSPPKVTPPWKRERYLSKKLRRIF